MELRNEKFQIQEVDFKCLKIVYVNIGMNFKELGKARLGPLFNKFFFKNCKKRFLFLTAFHYS